MKTKEFGEDNDIIYLNFHNVRAFKVAAEGEEQNFSKPLYEFPVFTTQKSVYTDALFNDLRCFTYGREFAFSAIGYGIREVVGVFDGISFKYSDEFKCFIITIRISQLGSKTIFFLDFASKTKVLYEKVLRIIMGFDFGDTISISTVKDKENGFPSLIFKKGTSFANTYKYKGNTFEAFGQTFNVPDKKNISPKNQPASYDFTERYNYLTETVLSAYIEAQKLLVKEREKETLAQSLLKPLVSENQEDTKDVEKLNDSDDLPF